MFRQWTCISWALDFIAVKIDNSDDGPLAELLFDRVIIAVYDNCFVCIVWLGRIRVNIVSGRSFGHLDSSIRASFIHNRD